MFFQLSQVKKWRVFRRKKKRKENYRYWKLILVVKPSVIWTYKSVIHK